MASRRTLMWCAVLVAVVLAIPCVANSNNVLWVRTTQPVHVKCREADYTKDPYNSLVTVFTSSSLGTGFFVSPHAVVTARHVVKGAKWAFVEGHMATAIFVRARGGYDVALLTFSEPVGRGRCLRISSMSPGPVQIFTRYDGTYIVGFARVVGVRTPFGWWFDGFEPKHGMSGSPVLRDGVVVGVVTHKTRLGVEGFAEDIDVIATTD